MALFSDNFESIVSIPADLIAAGWTTVNGSPTVETTIVQAGAKSIRLEDNDSIIRTLTYGTGPLEAVLKVWYRFSDTPSSNANVIRTYQGPLPNLSIQQDSSNKLQFHAQDDTALGGLSAALLPDTWYLIEILMKHYDSITLGDVQLFVDGVLQINLATATDTAWFGAPTTVDGFELLGPSTPGQFTYWDGVDFDDRSLESSSSSSVTSSSSATSSSSSVTSSSSSSSDSSSSLTSSASSSSSSSQSTASESSSSITSSSSSTSSTSSSSQSSSSVSSHSSSSQSKASSSSSSVTSSSSSSKSSSSQSSKSSSSSSVTSSSQSNLSSQSVSESSSLSSASSLSSQSNTDSESSVSSSSSSSASSSSDSSSGAFGANLFLCGTTKAFTLEAWRRRDTQYQLQLLDANEVSFIIDSTNVVLLKIGKVNHTPHLELNSLASTPNGSALTNTNPTIIRLDKDDLIFAAAIYDLEIIVLDGRTGEVVTTLETGSLILHETQRGVLSL